METLTAGQKVKASTYVKSIDWFSRPTKERKMSEHASAKTSMYGVNLFKISWVTVWSQTQEKDLLCIQLEKRYYLNGTK